MPHEIVRRSLLAGISAFPAATVAAALPSAALAHPAPPDAVLAEVAELARLFDAARRRTLAAAVACEAAEERYERPAIPVALFQRPDEPLHRYVQARRRPDDRFWYGDPDRIEVLRGWPMEHPGWEAQYARRAEILAAYDAWTAAIEAAQEAAGTPAANAEYAAAWDEELPARQRILALRSSHPAALALKLRVFMASIARADWRTDLDRKVDEAVEAEGGPWEDAFAASILRDLVTAYAQADA